MRNQTLRSYRLEEGDPLGWTTTEGGVVRIQFDAHGSGESLEILVPTVRLRRLLIDAGWIVERDENERLERLETLAGTIESEAVGILTEHLGESESRADALEETLGAIQRALGYPGDPVAEIENRSEERFRLMARVGELLERNRELGDQSQKLALDVLQSRRITRRSARRVGELEAELESVQSALDSDVLENLERRKRIAELEAEIADWKQLVTPEGETS